MTTKKPKTTTKPSLAEALRAAVLDSGLSINAIAARSGVPQPVLQRFASGQRDNIRLDTASKLAEFFGMHLTTPKAPRN